MKDIGKNSDICYNFLEFGCQICISQIKLWKIFVVIILNFVYKQKCTYLIIQNKTIKV